MEPETGNRKRKTKTGNRKLETQRRRTGNGSAGRVSPCVAGRCLTDTGGLLRCSQDSAQGVHLGRDLIPFHPSRHLRFTIHRRLSGSVFGFQFPVFGFQFPVLRLLPRNAADLRRRHAGGLRRGRSRDAPRSHGAERLLPVASGRTRDARPRTLLRARGDIREPLRRRRAHALALLLSLPRIAARAHAVPALLVMPKQPFQPRWKDVLRQWVTDDVVQQCRVAAPRGRELARPQECGNGRRHDAKQLQPYPSSCINREGHVRKLPAGIEQSLVGGVLTRTSRNQTGKKPGNRKPKTGNGK
jgi:hypothetical protein